MASSQHTRKRQYQPSNQSRLDSYFNRESTSRPMSPLSPSQPPDVAAGLLNVGMRVRKSVPEGYRTHKTLGSPGFPFPSSAPPAATVSVRPSISPMQTRELTPFCGLHKTGGWAAQETPSSSAPADLRRHTEDDEQDMPGLSMSQSTMFSTQEDFASVQPHILQESKKRNYEEDQEADMDNIFDEMDAEDNARKENISPLQRPMARMKGSSKAVNQSNVKIFDVDDFEDAAFLRPRMELD